MHTRVAGPRGDFALSNFKFARVVGNADTVACTIVGVGLVGGIAFGVFLALIIAWHASDEEDGGPSPKREEIERQLPGFEDEQSIRQILCDEN